MQQNRNYSPMVYGNGNGVDSEQKGRAGTASSGKGKSYYGKSPWLFWFEKDWFDLSMLNMIILL